jgi:hypothetical protein
MNKVLELKTQLLLEVKLGLLHLERQVVRNGTITDDFSSQLLESVDVLLTDLVEEAIQQGFESGQHNIMEALNY